MLVLVTTLSLLAACNRSVEPPAPEVRPVRVLTISKGSGSDVIALTGTVQAQTEVNLAFRIDGRLVERSVAIGDAVRPGQLVARLDPQNEESSLQSAQAQLSAARAQLTEARNNFVRMRDLVADRAVSRAMFDQAEAAQATAESRVESAQTQVTLAQNRLGYTRLVSDVAGVVTARGAEDGEVVGAGRMIIQVARDGGRDAVFDVPARLKDRALAGGAFTVVLTAEPTVSASGTVREVAPRADPVTGTFRVKVHLKNPPEVMRLGSTVTGRVSLAPGERIVIPPAAVIRADQQAAVWVVDAKSGTVASRTIRIGSADAAGIEVTAGLAPGDIIVTAGVQALRPGQKVRPVESRP
jgi:RND family efflux transporter MFP subunit